jgi:hypothetical protein
MYSVGEPSINRRILAVSSRTEVKELRRMACRVMMPKFSAMFSQNPDVGAKCRVMPGSPLAVP